MPSMSGKAGGTLPSPLAAPADQPASMHIAPDLINSGKSFRYLVFECLSNSRKSSQ